MGIIDNEAALAGALVPGLAGPQGDVQALLQNVRGPGHLGIGRQGAGRGADRTVFDDVQRNLLHPGDGVRVVGAALVNEVQPGHVLAAPVQRIANNLTLWAALVVVAAVRGVVSDWTAP